MNVETAEKVSKLLKLKAEYTSSLSELFSEDYTFFVAVRYSPLGVLIIDNLSSRLKVPKGVNEKVKQIVIIDLKAEIDRIDKEIEQLN